MSTDWATTGSWMQAWAGFAGAGAVFYAAHRGSSSFETWLRQRKVERKITAGDRILSVVYRAKDALGGVRAPLQLGYELDDAHKKLSEDASYLEMSGATQQKWKSAQITFNRMNAYAPVWKELFDCLPIARAYFGITVEEKLRAILQLRRNIEVSAEMYPQYAADTPNDDFAKKVRNDMWSMSKENDPIMTPMNEIVTFCEGLILPLLFDPGDATSTT